MCSVFVRNKNPGVSKKTLMKSTIHQTSEWFVENGIHRCYNEDRYLWTKKRRFECTVRQSQRNEKGAGNTMNVRWIEGVTKKSQGLRHRCYMNQE